MVLRNAFFAALAAAGSAAAAVSTHTTSQDFNNGQLSSAVVVNSGGGAVRLAAALDAWDALAAPDSRDYYAVHMPSTGTGFAVGTTRGDAHNSYNGIRYDGAAWSSDPSFGPGVELRAVAMTSPIEGWAGGGARMISYDTTEWFNEEELDAASPEIRGLHMLDQDAGFAVGAGGQVWSFDGAGWNAGSSPVTEDLNAVHMVSAADAWAVGAAGRILRYDGAAWSIASSPLSDTLNGVHMVSAASGWAVGASGKIIRYDGSEWRGEGTPTGSNLAGVWASADEGWVVGDGGTILRLDDGVWASTPSPTGEALKGVSCAVPERCLAVGLSGATLRYRRDYQSAGSFVSDLFDGGGAPDWGTLAWAASGLAAGVELKFQTSASDSNSPDDVDFRGPDGSAASYYTASGTPVWVGHDGKQYLRYKAFLSTSDALKSPRLESVSVSY